MKSQVLFTVWCNITGGAGGEIGHWSLSGVKGLSWCCWDTLNEKPDLHFAQKSWFVSQWRVEPYDPVRKKASRPCDHEIMVISHFILAMWPVFVYNFGSAFLWRKENPAMSNSSSGYWPKLLPRAEGVVFFVGFVLESIAIIVANVLTIVIFRRDPNLNQAKFYLLVNLAVADLLVGLVCGPFWTFNLAFPFDLWPPPTHVALWWIRYLPEMAELLAKFASLISLTMIAVERVFATYLPVQYRSFGRQGRYVLIAICWALAALFPLNYLGAAVLNVISLEVGLYTMLGLTCLFLLVTCLSYLAIWLKIKASHYGTSSQRELKLTVSLFLVTVVSLAAWLPSQAFFSVFMVGMVRGHHWFSMDTFNRVTNATFMLLLANSLVNPIIYAFRIPQFRQSARKLFRRMSRRESSTEGMKDQCLVAVNR